MIGLRIHLTLSSGGGFVLPLSGGHISMMTTLLKEANSSANSSAYIAIAEYSKFYCFSMDLLLIKIPSDCSIRSIPDPDTSNHICNPPSSQEIQRTFLLSSYGRRFVRRRAGLIHPLPLPPPHSINPPTASIQTSYRPSTPRTSSHFSMDKFFHCIPIIRRECRKRYFTRGHNPPIQGFVYRWLSTPSSSNNKWDQSC